jgi:D-alanine transaminase
VSGIAYVNGLFLPIEEARVSVEDRGFQFADGVYEVLRTYNGKIFAMEEHLQRLARSLDAVEIKNAPSSLMLADIIRDGLHRSQCKEAVIYLQITRGVAPRKRDFPKHVEPTVVMTVRELEPLPDEIRERGLRTITMPDNRWGRCDIKSTALLANVLAYNKARAAGVDDAIFVGADGFVSEATAGNVFVFDGTRLNTPPSGPRILSGITREKMLKLAPELRIPAREAEISVETLKKAHEIFVTSTTIECVSVVQVDDAVIGTGKPGALAMRLREEFLKRVCET